VTVPTGRPTSARREAAMSLQGDLDDRAETVEPPVAEPRTKHAVGELFRHRAFMRLWVSRLFGTASNQMLLVALGWQMYDLTHSAWDLASSACSSSCPRWRRCSSRARWSTASIARGSSPSAWPRRP
jgi:hypothetical protein